MKPLLAWALFDLANTFFAVAMLSFHFPLWIVEDRGGRELFFSIALGISMLCVAVIMPFCGAMSDASGTRMRFLRWTTYGCAASTMLIGLTPNLASALILFGLANICYQLGTVFYDALLWNVSPPATLGRASGIGAAFGYLGSMLGLLLLWPFLRWGGRAATFAPSAAFFLLFAAPSFLMIRDTAPAAGPIRWRHLARTAIARLADTVRSARRSPALWRYCWASFFSLNAINTVLVFMAVYTRKVLAFTDEQAIRFFLFSQVFSVAGSLAFGSVVSRCGAKRTLSLIWSGWMAALVLIGLNPSPRWLWVIGPVIGFCLGSTWATSRVLLIELSSKERLAEMLGLAGLFARASSTIGPLLWGVLVTDPARQQQAVLSMAGLLAIGIGLLSRVPDPRP
jgi:UMF1 family MFS transporter